MSILHQIIKKDCVCFDIGAYTLEKTYAMLNIGARKVIAVEPQFNFKNLPEEIIFVNKAVSNRVGVTDFFICEAAKTISTMAPHWQQGRFKSNSWGTTIQVETTTLDRLIEEYGVPYYCKIDVEGYEAAVLQGLSQVIPYISFEFTKEYMNHAVQCIDILDEISRGRYRYTFTKGIQDPQNFESEWLDKRNLLAKIDIAKDDWGDIHAKED